MADLEIVIDSSSGSETIIRLTGAFEGMDALNEESRLLETVRICQKKCVLDMSGVEYIDSSALGILIKCAKLGKQLKKNVILINPKPEILKIIKVMSLDKMLSIITR